MIFHIHKWYTIKRMGHQELFDIVQYGKHHYTHYREDWPFYFRRVCIKCQKVDDQITPQIELFKKQILTEKLNEQLARQIYDKHKMGY